MGLHYKDQAIVPLVGTRNAAGTLTSVALTSAYQSEAAGHPTKTFDVGGYSRVDFAISYTMGATETSNSIEMKLEWSPDAVNFYQFTTDSTSSGTSTMNRREFTYVGADAATSKVTWGIDISYKDTIRVSFKETGVASNAGSVYCEAVLSGL